MAVLADTLRAAAAASPAAPAVIMPHRSWSYADLDRLSSAMAANLLAAGLAPGDRLALHLGNGIEIVIAYFACFKSGVIALPVNTRFKAGEIEYVLRHAEAAAYIGQPELAREIAGWPPAMRLRYATGGGMVGVRPFDELLASGAAAPAVAPADDAPATVLYTSGTTAKPKGVTHTQATLAWVGDLAYRAFYAPGDVTFAPLPLVHMAALLAMCAAMRGGLPMALLPQFDPHQALDLVERHRVTTFIGMPVLYRTLVEAQRTKPRDVASLRACWVGGDSVPAVLQEQFTASFGQPLAEAYGLSEIVPVSFNAVDDIRCGSLGRPAPGVDVRLVGDDGATVRAGEVGEIAVACPGTMVGYWNSPEETARAFRGGWFLTGDLARQDTDGVLWFAGRKKEIIVRGGSNIAPQEVEDVIYQHPAVAEAAVVGVPDETWGETVAAGVALRPQQTVVEADLVGFVRARLSLYKCPERIVFLPALPKGPTGKILRRAVRETIAGGQ